MLKSCLLYTSYVYGEYRGKVNKLDYRLGVGVTRSYYKQSGDGDDGYGEILPCMLSLGQMYGST